MKAATWVVAGIVAAAAFAASRTARKRVTAATAEQRQRMLDLWGERGYPRDEVQKTIALESGWRTDANNGVGYSGLLQFGSQARSAVGYHGTADEFSHLSFAAQWPYYQKFVRGLPAWGQPGDARLVLFTPAFIREPNDFVIAAADGPRISWWQQNRSLREGYSRLDRNPPGPITAGSVRGTVA